MTSIIVSESNPPGNNNSSIPATTAIRMPDKLMHKNHLQQFVQRSSMALPLYQTTNEGFLHSPRYRASVVVDGVTYMSPNTFSQLKAAEQDVARIALASIKEKIKTDPLAIIGEGCSIITEGIFFCKSIVMELVTKANLEKPVYDTIQLQGLVPIFESSVTIKGVTYKGVPSRNKKDAQQLAARAAMKSMLGDSNYSTILFEIIKSKGKLFDTFYEIKEPENTRDGIVPLDVYSENGQNAVNIIKSVQSKADGSNTRPQLDVSEAYSGQITHGPALPLEAYPEKDQDTVTIIGSCQSQVKATNTCLPLGVSETKTGQISHRQVMPPQPFHQFTIPKEQLPPEAVAPPMAFVPPALQQTEVGLSSSSKKRKRKKKNKQSAMDVDLNATASPFNQVQPRSVAHRVA